MKWMVYIFSLILFLLSSGENKKHLSFVSSDQQIGFSLSITRSQRDAVIASNSSCSGSSNISSPSFNFSSACRRTSSNHHSSIRFLKGGKLLDNNHIVSYIEQIFICVSGKYLTEKYLFFICNQRE